MTWTLLYFLSFLLDPPGCDQCPICQGHLSIFDWDIRIS